ncbi:hypothetical protein ACWGGS_01595 [Streptomyces decoyicus]
MAGVIAIRGARGGAGHTPGQDLRLTDPEGAATALTTPGWQFAGDLSGDDETPMAVTVPNLAEELPLSGTARSRVSVWMTRTLAATPLADSFPRGAADGTVPGRPQLER